MEPRRQPESHRAEPAPLVSRGGWDPHPGVIFGSRRPSRPWEEALEGQGSGGPVTSTPGLERVKTPS